jgi:HAD superfamily hydrolase (TIGR01509 family)
MAATGDSDIKAVFFDFGGTLFSYTTINGGGSSRSLFVEAAERLGVSADPKAIGRAYGKASAAAFQKYTVQQYYLHKDLFLDTFRGFAANLDATPTPEFLDWLYQSQRDLLVEAFQLRADCMETLEQLRAGGLYLSIVSNIDDDYLHPMVARAGLGDVLHHYTSSEEAQSCKPDAGFFQLAMKKAKCDAGDVLFVGDSPTHDVAGANALGMKTALIIEPNAAPPGQTGNAPAADHEIRSLKELVEICL